MTEVAGQTPAASLATRQDISAFRPGMTGQSRRGRPGKMKLQEEVCTNGHTTDSEEEEEAEPVSGTLVLRVVSQPASPGGSRKTSAARQPPAFLNGDDHGPGAGETFLTVQVQRSSSSGSLARSRHSSAGAGAGDWQLERARKRSQFSSRESSFSPGPPSTDLDLSRPR